MVEDNPMPLSPPVIKSGPEIAPIDCPLNPYRDDNGTAHPQNYRLTELSFEYSLPNPYDRNSPFKHKIHGWLAVPTTTTSTGKYPAVLVVNGHSGSALGNDTT